MITDVGFASVDNHILQGDILLSSSQERNIYTIYIITIFKPWQLTLKVPVRSEAGNILK